MADKDGGPILLRQDAAHGGGILLKRHERILYRSRVETHLLQMCDYIEPRGSVGVKAVHQDNILGFRHVLSFDDFGCHCGHNSCGEQCVECSAADHTNSFKRLTAGASCPVDKRFPAETSERLVSDADRVYNLRNARRTTRDRFRVLAL